MVIHPDNQARRKMRATLIDRVSSRRGNGCASVEDEAGNLEAKIYSIDDYRSPDAASSDVDDEGMLADNVSAEADWALGELAATVENVLTSRASPASAATATAP